MEPLTPDLIEEFAAAEADGVFDAAAIAHGFEPAALRADLAATTFGRRVAAQRGVRTALHSPVSPGLDDFARRRLRETAMAESALATTTHDGRGRRVRIVAIAAAVIAILGVGGIVIARQTDESGSAHPTAATVPAGSAKRSASGPVDLGDLGPIPTGAALQSVVANARDQRRLASDGPALSTQQANSTTAPAASATTTTADAQYVNGAAGTEFSPGNGAAAQPGPVRRCSARRCFKTISAGVRDAGTLRAYGTGTRNNAGVLVLEISHAHRTDLWVLAPTTCDVLTSFSY
jgi:hypothetical protein